MNNRSLLILLTLFVCACRTETPRAISNVDFYATEFFHEVQTRAIFKDSKTFTDLVPLAPYSEVLAKYELEKDNADFDLKAFVENNFSDQSTAVLSFETDTTKTMYEHISSIWPKLTRGPDKIIPFSSRIPLPYSYVVPGGRFKEIYYWDSYFTIEGLLVDDELELAKNMVANFSHLIDSIGFIPNGTRNYYLTRSQPPFFSLMVDALSKSDSTAAREYFPSIVREYQFWMKGMDSVPTSSGAYRYTVQLGDTLHLNRYWDMGTTPRPEAYKEDRHLAGELNSEEEKQALYVNLRAAAASGWDFSSRWFLEDEFASTATSRIIPVDLNCLMYFMEKEIAEGFAIQGNKESAEDYEKRAAKRAKAIQTLFWNPDMQYFHDYHLDSGSTMGQLTLAGAFPLYFELASPEQAKGVRNRLMNDFLRDGGLLTTLKDSGQQWDAPNGWAPLQWIAVKGLLNYGYHEEAITIMERWLALNERVYRNTGKMMEKYNVEDITLLSGGGEYETQDGFGWTNGVALGFRELLDQLKEE
ncbi:trehalase family glycosidase [Lentiprolixibacter aurantiacus]|uniref:Trehalase family glycosidase n=1 Tax=Lentiprolixibacter aurantiacus TaxID=2993939 RepID=A0AAE3SMZ1_9FLAO|nr:trehalase family glycosidase [Lentiprolixibacter aurantiacus]MCX2718816.1 trehalase family glycosidase [Lentiprolixibacter aurantiacus]